MQKDRLIECPYFKVFHLFVNGSFFKSCKFLMWSWSFQVREKGRVKIHCSFKCLLRAEKLAPQSDCLSHMLLPKSCNYHVPCASHNYYFQECIMQKERSRSVKRPRFNWIFFLPTRASGYTIFR